MADVTTEILLRDSYIGNVATNCQISRNFFAGNKQSMSRSIHRARDRIKRLKLVYANWYVNLTAPIVETNPGGPATITASIEYNGSFYQATFGGNVTGNVADGDNIVSDWINVDIPNGDRFFARCFYQNAAGVIFTGLQNTAVQHTRAEFGASGITDKTMGGSVGVTSGSVCMAPVAIIAETRKGSVLIIGDSIAYGQGDSADSTDDTGILARSVGKYAPFINVGSQSDRAVHAKDNGTKRFALGQYCSHVLCNYGFNDLMNGGVTSASLQSYINTIRGYFIGRPFFVTTVTPKTTSTDSWATVANQTVTAQESVRTSYNDAVRAGSALDIVDVIDTADAIEVNSSGVKTRNGGFFPAAGTADGTHPTQALYLAVKAANIIPEGWLR